MSYQKYLELIKQRDAIVEQLDEIGVEAIKEVFTDLFVKNAGLKSISWKQYTDYFNDGDTCYFSVYGYGDSIGINGSSEYEEDDYDDEEVDDDIDEEVTEEDVVVIKLDEDKVRKEASEIIESFDEDWLESLFGDHVRVIVTRNGITTEGYQDHD